MQSEIQEYFRNVADQFEVVPHIHFECSVEVVRWDDDKQYWEITIKTPKETITRRARAVVSAVGSLSIPQPCKIPGTEMFAGPLFHSAKWDHSFDWQDKDVVVLGNGCSATQFVPVVSQTAKRLTQFARQAQFLAERPNPRYSDLFKRVMRDMPGAARLYRLNEYANMEKDFAGFDVETGSSIRQGLKDENERYVKRMAPERYWDALIPTYEIGCKRKVMDTDYLATLHRDNVELIPDDPVHVITADGVRTQSGREVHADAIVLATGFEVFRMLFPMQITGKNGVSLNTHWDEKYQGAAQAYFGTCVPGFPNFFCLMGPNTVTGHLSVIYTVECQINFVLRLLGPILKPKSRITAVDVKPEAGQRDSSWMQSKLRKLVWSSGCTSWALDPKTGINIAMYPEYQYWFWWRSIFIRSEDFLYTTTDETGKKHTKRLIVGGQRTVSRAVQTVTVLGLLISAGLGVERIGGWQLAGHRLRQLISA